MDKFYGREKELEILKSHWDHKSTTVDVLIGRRRIGKTFLALKYANNKKNLYFFTSRKEVPALLEEWSFILRQEFPSVTSFSGIDEFLKVLFVLIQKEKYLVIFDEFQNFKYTSPSAYSTFQKHIDLSISNGINVHILFLGSSTTLMEKVFKDKKEPLFGRATRIIKIEGFSFGLTRTILGDFGFNNIDFIFGLYSIINGIPKYYDILFKESKSVKSISDFLLEHCLSKDSSLASEGYFLLETEFGKEYQKYFDILTLISSGRTKPTEIAGELFEPVNKIAVYLNRLDNYYGLIEKRTPVFKSKQVEIRYYLKDIFLRFWFRYIYKRLSYIERENGKFILKHIENDLTNYYGAIFEELCLKLFLDENTQKRLNLDFDIWEYGKYWNSKSNVELDIIAYDKKNVNLLIIECKYNYKRINKALINQLIQKSKISEFNNFKKINFAFFTLLPPNKKIREMCKDYDIKLINLESYS